MKLIDREGRLFGKISIIDVLVLAVVIVMAVALYVKTNHREITSTYQILVSGVRGYVADAIREKDMLYDVDNSSGGALGEITDIQVMEGAKLAEYDDGTMEMTPVEDGVNLLLTVEGRGIISDGRYLVNRVYDLGVNSARNYHTPYAQFTGTVVAID